jgi:predicted phage terminase large subunit-like protein
MNSTAASQSSKPSRGIDAAAELRALKLEKLRRLEAAAEVARFDWTRKARPDQRTPIDGATPWRVWLLLAGRGFGKTRTGAEHIRERVMSGAAKRIALVARSAADVRDVIVEGESGILAVSPPSERPTWEPSRRRLTWPNGAIATTYSADEPDQLRGPQHDYAWADELAAWRYPDAWDQLLFGLRLGADPRAIVTTTPRPTPIIRALVSAATTHVTRGRTRDNAANLAPGFLDAIVARFEGTRLGRQELDGEILDDNPGALWKRSGIDDARVSKAPDLRRIVVGVDPAVTSNAKSDETGIVVAGLGYDGRFYVLGDYSGRYSPDQWASRVVKAYRDHKADRVIAESNQGGDLVAQNIRTVDRNLPVATVHAKRGKALRAEPVSSLYEQGRVSHVGSLAALEDQMTAWDPAGDGESPDRVDALVYALTELAPAYGDDVTAPPRTRTAAPRWGF